MSQTTVSGGTKSSGADTAIPTETTSTSATSADRFASAKARITDEAGKLKDKAAVKATEYADVGKDKASDALNSLSKLLTDAAGTVDQKLGENYGNYARKTADAISGAADSLREKKVESIIDDARDFVQKSPALAIGIAAAAGFVIARLMKSDSRDA